MRKPAGSTPGGRPELHAVSAVEGAQSVDDDQIMSAVFGDRRRWATADAATGKIVVHPIGSPLTTAEAHSLCMALLASADFAEHGPGEWRNGTWYSDLSMSEADRSDRAALG